jgi:hypothetical protein
MDGSDFLIAAETRWCRDRRYYRHPGVAKASEYEPKGHQLEKLLLVDSR